MRRDPCPGHRATGPPGHRAVTVAGLVVGAPGIAVLWASGVAFPFYPPPGAIILLVAAALTAFLPFRWSPVAAILAALFLIFGLFRGQANRLIEVHTVADTPGLWLQMIMMVVAGVAAVLALTRPTGSRTRREPVSQ
jgi:hypothetical protein